MAEMHSNMEQMQEGTNIVKQQWHPKKMPDEGVRGSDLLQDNKKKIFIRSRFFYIVPSHACSFSDFHIFTPS
ncbi:hypothetical protein DVH24_003561 [Malus domestica]|uniref:Uncharacterized protein n=1 Tax=Malus domestica TaxID=3750 RepID=A0A498IPA8_MALDO|nr:hypothetical protein DVH24_003561 [Malus domestica]